MLTIDFCLLGRAMALQGIINVDLMTNCFSSPTKRAHLVFDVQFSSPDTVVPKRKKGTLPIWVSRHRPGTDTNTGYLLLARCIWTTAWLCTTNLPSFRKIAVVVV